LFEKGSMDAESYGGSLKMEVL